MVVRGSHCFSHPRVVVALVALVVAWLWLLLLLVAVVAFQSPNEHSIVSFFFFFFFSFHSVVVGGCFVGMDPTTKRPILSLSLDSRKKKQATLNSFRVCIERERECNCLFLFSNGVSDVRLLECSLVCDGCDDECSLGWMMEWEALYLAS